MSINPVVFLSKIRRHRIYVDGIKVEFEDGRFQTTDDKIIDGLKKSPAFGVRIIIAAIKDVAPVVEKAVSAVVAPVAVVKEESVKGKYQCSKCDFSTDNISESRTHNLTAHKG